MGRDIVGFRALMGEVDGFTYFFSSENSIHEYLGFHDILPSGEAKKRAEECLLHVKLLRLKVKVLLCFSDNHRREHNQADQVGNCHQSVEGVGDIPDEAKLCYCTNTDQRYEDYPIW